MKPINGDSPVVKLQSSSWDGSYVVLAVSDFKEYFQ